MTITEPTETTLGPFSAPGASITPWDATVDALRRIQKYYVSTVRPDGRPHVTPLLATVALDGLCFSTGETERKAKNLSANPHCILTTGVNTLTGTDYVIEGIATAVTDDVDLRSAAATFETNFGWHLTDPEGFWYGMGDMIRDRSEVLYQLLPTVAFAYGNSKAFSETRYRWNDRLRQQGTAAR